MNHNIIIIDKNVRESRLLNECLIGSGYKNITTVSSIQEGLALCEAQDFDLFIVDSHLPDGDGFECCEKLKSLDMPCKVIIVTGDIESIDARKAREVGADDYCVKTMDCSYVLEAVDRLLKESLC